MSRRTTVEIKEDTEYLQSLLASCKTIHTKEKIQVLYLLKSGRCQHINQLALIVGKHRKTIHQWLAYYEQEGLRCWLDNEYSRPGRKSIIPNSLIKIIRQKLLKKEFSSYGQIQRWLQTNYQISVKYHVVRDLVSKKLRLPISR